MQILDYDKVMHIYWSILFVKHMFLLFLACELINCGICMCKMYDSKLNNGLLMTIHGLQSNKLQDPVRVML